MPSAGRTIALRQIHEANLRRMFKNSMQEWIALIVNNAATMDANLMTALFIQDVVMQTIKDLPPREKVMLVGLVQDWGIVGRVTATVQEVSAFSHARGWSAETTKQAMEDAISLRSPGSAPSPWSQTAWESDIDRMARNIATASDAMATKYRALAHGKNVRWISKRDDKVRKTHVIADGQSIPADSYFTVGGYLVEFPGDPSAPAQERINCRCVLVIVDPVTGRTVSDADLDRETDEALEQMQAEGITASIAAFGAPNQARIQKGQRGGGQWTDTPASILDDLKTVTGEELKEGYTSAVQEALDSTGTGMHIDSRMHVRSTGANTLIMTLKDENGSATDPNNGLLYGEIRRIFYPEEKKVANWQFTLNRNLQGKGIGSAVTEATDKKLREMGYESIIVTANIDVGGFTWARQGFEYDSRRSANQHAYDVWSRMDTGPAKDAAGALFDSSRGNPNDPAPFLPADLVGIGWEEGLSDWPGKNASLGTTWDGIKYLNPKPAEESLTAAAPNQARVQKGNRDGGQWLDTPSGILHDLGGWSGEEEDAGDEAYFVPDVNADWTTGRTTRDALPDPNDDDFDFDAALALGHYSSDAGSGINHHVRDGGLESDPNGFLSGVVKDLDGGFANSHTSEDALFYRGLDGKAFGGEAANMNDLLGRVIKDKGFLSMTADDEVAYRFAGYENPVIMEIKVPKGTPAIKVGGSMAGYGDRESEVLFPRDLPIAIESVENLGGEWRIKATVGEKMDDSLTAAAPNQARILKGNPDGGQWTDTPHSIMLHNIAVDGPEAALAYLQEHPEDREALMAEVRAEGQRQREAEDSVRERMEPEEEADIFPDRPEDIGSDDPWSPDYDGEDEEGVDPFGDDLMWQDKSIDQMNGQDLYEMTVEAIEGPLREFGITVIDNGSGGDLGDAYMSLKLIGPEGQFVGLLERAVSADGVVENQQFVLDPAWQGQGIASKLTPAMEDMWRSKGYTEVVVHANIDVGGYTWARQGFQFANSWEVPIVLDRVREGAGWPDIDPDDWDDNPHPLGSKEYVAWNDYRDVRVKLDNGETVLPAEIAGIGWTEGAESWPGKDGMLGSDWQGYKELDPFGEGPAYAARTLTAAAPNQARVLKGNRAGGQWLDTPSAVLADLGWVGERDDIFADRDTYFVPDTEGGNFDIDSDGRDIRTVLPSPGDVDVFTDEERSQLKDYTGSYAEELNQNLRNGIAGDAQVRHIDSAMLKSKLAEDATLYRMIKPEFLPDTLADWDGSVKDLDSIVGKVIKDRGFLSTSTEEFPAYAEGEGWPKFVIKAPAGTSAINMKPISHLPWESEVLLDRKTPLGITGYEVDDETGEIIVYMTVAEPMDDKPDVEFALVAAGVNQARILKGNPGGGQWVDTPSAVLDQLGWQGEKETDRQETFTTREVNPKITDPYKQEDALHFDMTEGMTPNEGDAIQWYTKHGDQYINGLARNGEEWDGFIAPDGTDYLGEAERATDAMDGYLRRSRTPHDLFAYRGVGKNLPSDPADLDSLVGKVISDPGFLSTSVYDFIARDFVDRGNHSTEHPILKISVPGGTPAIWADPASLNQGEAELIFGMDTPLAITGWYRDEKGFPVIEATIGYPVMPEGWDELTAAGGPSQARILKGNPDGGQWTETPNSILRSLNRLEHGKDEGPITIADLEGHTPEEVKAAAKAKADEILAREGRPSTDEISARVGDIYDRATPEQREAGERWYDEAARLAQEMVDDPRTNLTFEQAAAVISHTSPLTFWAVNKAIAQTFAAGGSFEDARAAAKANGGFAMGDGWKKAVEAAGSNDPLNTFGAGANKTKNFAENIVGDKFGVTVDTHMYRVLGQLKDTTGKIEGTPQWKRSDQTYEALAQSVRIAADERGVDPAAMQATTWVWMLENFNPERQGHPANIYDLARDEEIPMLIGGDPSRVASGAPGPVYSPDATPIGYYYAQAEKFGFMSPLRHSLTAAGPDQVRAPKGTNIGGQWIDTPAGILADIQSGKTAMSGIREKVQDQGGASISPITGQEPIDGFMVAVQGHNLEVPADVFFGPGGEDALYSWIEDNIEALSAQGAHIGLWHDTENGEVVFDVSQRVDTIAEAIRLGKERNQQAIWDVANGEEIDTGGTGDRQPDDDRMSAIGEHHDRRTTEALRAAPGGLRRVARGAEARLRARVDRVTRTFAGVEQVRAPKGTAIGGQWIDTPTAVLGDMQNAYGNPVSPQTIGRTGVTAPTLENNSPIYAMEGANPNYGADPDYRINCQKTTAVYEMRRRGMDVQAAGGLGENAGTRGLPAYFEIKATSKRVPIMDRGATAQDVARNTAQSLSRNYPAGSRGAISASWKTGGGHIFNWEIDGMGDIHFIDAQSGLDVTYDLDFWETIDPMNVVTQRLDDAAIRDAALDTIDTSRLTPEKPE